MDALEQALRHQVARYLSRQSSVRDLYEWLAPVAWNVEARATGKVAVLVREVELYLAEFQHGDWTDDELQGRLRGALHGIAAGPERCRPAGPGQRRAATD